MFLLCLPYPYNEAMTLLPQAEHQIGALEKRRKRLLRAGLDVQEVNRQLGFRQFGSSALRTLLASSSVLLSKAT